MHLQNEVYHKCINKYVIDILSILLILLIYLIYSVDDDITLPFYRSWVEVLIVKFKQTTQPPTAQKESNIICLKPLPPPQFFKKKIWSNLCISSRLEIFLWDNRHILKYFREMIGMVVYSLACFFFRWSFLSSFDPSSITNLDDAPFFSSARNSCGLLLASYQTYESVFHFNINLIKLRSGRIIATQMSMWLDLISNSN